MTNNQSDTPVERHEIVRLWLSGDLDAGGCIAALERECANLASNVDWQERAVDLVSNRLDLVAKINELESALSAERAKNAALTKALQAMMNAAVPNAPEDDCLHAQMLAADALAL